MRSDEYDYLIKETHDEIITNIEYLFSLMASRQLWEAQNQCELPDYRDEYINMYVSELGVEDGEAIGNAILGED
ncbi:hypothetical protein PBI_GRAYSON_183 [Rhodococcus phage Grayson]|nr:hypothetical protein PBI_GRAYSON_183 [Rhodococcus phage Grayson]